MIRFKQSGDSLAVILFGEIDHCAVQSLRTQIESYIKDTSPRHLILDFSHVSFMDSSGIGMIIGRYKTMAAMNGSVSAYGMQKPVERLFRMSGLHRIIDVISSEGEELS